MAPPWPAEDQEWAPESDDFYADEAPRINDKVGRCSTRSLGYEVRMTPPGDGPQRGSALINDPAAGLVLMGRREVAWTKAYDLVCFLGKEHI